MALLQILRRSVAFLRAFVTADISAEKCVHFLKQAQEDAFNTLKEKAKDDEWLEAFLNARGLEVIVQELYFSIHFPSKDSDTSHHGDSLPFRFVSSLRQVLNRSNLTGFDEFMTDPDYTKKLVRYFQQCTWLRPLPVGKSVNIRAIQAQMAQKAQWSIWESSRLIIIAPGLYSHQSVGLYSSEVKVKRTIIEILTAEIKLYEDGHQYVMDALQDYKVYNQDVYSLCVIVKDLRNVELMEPEDREETGEPDPQYQAILLAFINCIISDEESSGKIKLRNELNELGFYDILETLSESENKDLLVQWLEFYRLGEENVFYQQTSNNQEDGAFDDVDSPACDGNTKEDGNAPPPRPPPLPAGPDCRKDTSGSLLDGTRWQNNVQAKQLLDPMPKPSKEMLALLWEKVDISQLGGDSENLWKEVIGMEDSISLDTVALEKRFAKKVPSALGFPQSKTVNISNPEIKSIEIDHKRRLEINVVLRTTKDYEEVVRKLKAGMDDDINIEVLEQLSKILPKQEELETVKSLGGNISKHEKAEEFFLLFEDFDNYKDFVQATLLKKKLTVVNREIKRNINTTVLVCEQIMNSWSLKAFLRYVLHIGNFINSQSKVNGKAVGFHLGSLLKLSELKSAGKEKITLLQHLVEDIETKKMSLLDFVDDLHQNLTDNGRFDDIVEDLKKFRENAKMIQNINDRSSRVKEHFHSFFQKTTKELDGEERRFEVITSRMQQYFCVKGEEFKLQKFLQTFKRFCDEVQNVRRAATAKSTNTRRSLTVRSPAMSVYSPSSQARRPMDDVISSLSKRDYRLRKTQSQWNKIPRVETTF